jgi:hypothetical protein
LRLFFAVAIAALPGICNGAVAEPICKRFPVLGLELESCACPSEGRADVKVIAAGVPIYSAPPERVGDKGVTLFIENLMVVSPTRVTGQPLRIRVRTYLADEVHEADHIEHTGDGRYIAAVWNPTKYVHCINHEFAKVDSPCWDEGGPYFFH